MSSEQPQPMTPNQVIVAWRKFDYTFPEEAFRAASVPDKAMLNRFLAEVEEVADFPEALDLVEYWSSLFSLYVLAWHRDKRVLAPLMRLFDKTGQDFFDLWGDSVSDDASRLFASWAYSDPDALKPLIEIRPKMYENTRSSALEAYLVLYHAGKVTTDSVQPYLQHLADSVLRKHEDSRDGWLWYSWARCCVDMGLESMYPLVKQAYEEKWIDPTISGWDYEEKELQAGREAILERSRREYGRLIEDPLVELRGWHCFTEEARLADLADERRQAAKQASVPQTREIEPFYHPDTIVNETPKTRPNQPCSCGSGKKYKKCCGRG